MLQDDETLSSEFLILATSFIMFATLFISMNFVITLLSFSVHFQRSFIVINKMYTRPVSSTYDDGFSTFPVFLFSGSILGIYSQHDFSNVSVR
jgi:hypothetical protein